MQIRVKLYFFSPIHRYHYFRKLCKREVGDSNADRVHCRQNDCYCDADSDGPSTLRAR